MNKRQIGIIGEDIACKYLIENSYKLVERNFNCNQGEIDIIVKDINTNEVVFVEVKSRNSKKYGRGIDSIDKRKIKHIINSAKYYLYINKSESNIRFDVIEVYLKDKKINHIKQII